MRSAVVVPFTFPPLIPFYLIAAISLLLFSLAFESGFRLGKYQLVKNPQKEPKQPVGSMVGALLALLAFLLTFTFGMTSSNFQLRRQLVLAESNAIGTTYLRADFAPPNYREKIRPLLREYVEARLVALKDIDKLAWGLARSEQLQEELWGYAARVAEENPTPISALFIQSLNEMIDMHSKRVMAGLYTKIPDLIWVALLLLSLLSILSLGYYCGLTGERSIVATVLFIVSFTGIVLLIWDLDHPVSGLIKVGQQSMIDLLSKMQNAS